MKLSFILQEGGFTADNIETKCDIDFVDGAIVSSHLTVNASIPNITKEQFDTAVTDAKENCPISKLYNTKITAEATLA